MNNRSAMSLVAAQNIYMFATQSAMKVFELSSHLPPEDTNTLRTSIIDSSSKVCKHLNNAWQNRESPEIFVTNIRIASIEAKRTMEYIKSAGDAKYIDPQVCDAIKGAYERLVDQISDMMQGAK